MGVATSSKKRNGVNEWIFQRISNLAIIAWFIIYLGLIIVKSPTSYEAWVLLHSALWFKIYSSTTLVLASLNSMLAGWQIGTDYIQKVPFSWFGPLYYTVCFALSIIYFASGLYILWVVV